MEPKAKKARAKRRSRSGNRPNWGESLKELREKSHAVAKPSETLLFACWRSPVFLAGAAAVQQAPPLKTSKRLVRKRNNKLPESNKRTPSREQSLRNQYRKGLSSSRERDYRYDSRGRRDPFVSLALGMNILAS